MEKFSEKSSIPPKRGQDRELISGSMSLGQNNTRIQQSDLSLEIGEKTIPLRQEGLVVNRSKRKIGEIVVRKEIATKTVQVPVRREKLIIEQVGSDETKQLAEIDLGEGEVTGIEQTEIGSSGNSYTVNGEFFSLKAASEVLQFIALENTHGCSKVRIELVLEDRELQETYQKMFERCSQI